MLSKAGDSLGRLLRQGDVEDAHVAVATSFWDAAVDLGEGAALVGFGWIAAADKLGDEDWARLTQKTLGLTGGKLDCEHKVADRALASGPSTTMLSIMNSLVRNPIDEWGRRNTAEKAAALLQAAAELAGTPEYERLRTTLLERGALQKSLDLPD